MYTPAGSSSAPPGELGGPVPPPAPRAAGSSAMEAEEEEPSPPGFNVSAAASPPPPPVPRSALEGAVLLLALVGNALVLWGVRGIRPRRRRDLLVGHLALADLAGCGLSLLPGLAAVPPGPAACRLLPLLQRCGMLCSAHGLVLLALERRRPALPARALAALGWLLAPLLALPHAFAVPPAPRAGGQRCRSAFEEPPRWRALALAAYGGATAFLAPAGLLGWACARSLPARRGRRRAAGGGGAARGAARPLRLPVVLAGLFALCRLPRSAAELGLASAPDGGAGRREALAALGVVAAASSALNPFACLLLHGRLRRRRGGSGSAGRSSCCFPGLDGQGRRGATLRQPLRRRAGTPGGPKPPDGHVLGFSSSPGGPVLGSPAAPGGPKTPEGPVPGSPAPLGGPETPGGPVPGSPSKGRC